MAGLRPYLRNMPASVVIPLQAKMFLPCICTPSFAPCGFIPLQGKRATPEGAHFGNHGQRKTLGAWGHVLACVLPMRRPHGVNTAVFRCHEHRLGQRARGQLRTAHVSVCVCSACGLRGRCEAGRDVEGRLVAPRNMTTAFSLGKLNSLCITPSGFACGSTVHCLLC
jgi:hypothetical protein